MKGTYLWLCLVVCLAVVICEGSKMESHPLTTKLDREHLRSAFSKVQTFLKKHESAQKKIPMSTLTVECALCGIAVNEIEGFLMENISEAQIIQFIQNDICALFPSGLLKSSCDDLTDQIPAIIQLIQSKNTPSTVCIEIGFCIAPFEHHPDPSAVPMYIIDLDSPPAQRWNQVCSNPSYQAAAQFLYGVVASLLADGGVYIGDVGSLLNDYYFPTDYGQEIKGCASQLGIPYGWLALFNIGYEVSDACTSIVAQTTEGKILHARSMDFWAGMGFTDTLKNITFISNFQKGGKTAFLGTSFAGYVGILSGMKPNAFSVTINTRFYPQGPGDIFYEIVAAIMENNASLVSFLSRRVLENENNFPSAVQQLSGDNLIADVYYSVAGVSAGQGSIISRNRLNATDVWTLNVTAGRWFEVQTNYDHWTLPPWFDDRVVPANRGMNAIGQKNLSLGGMLDVLTIKPVLNIQTTYSILACPADGTYKSYTRWCPYPCVE